MLCTFLIPKPYSNILTLLGLPIAIKYIFKINIFRSFLAEFIPVALITTFEMFLSKLFFIGFDLDYFSCANIPLYRFLINTIIYLTLFLLSLIVKNANFSIKFFSNINKTNKYLLFANILLAFVVIFMQMYLIGYYNDLFPAHIIFFNILFLLVYSLLSVFSLMKTMNLAKTSENLEQEKLTNKTLQILHDSTRAFKHDFSLLRRLVISMFFQVLVIL